MTSFSLQKVRVERSDFRNVLTLLYFYNTNTSSVISNVEAWSFSQSTLRLQTSSSTFTLCKQTIQHGTITTLSYNQQPNQPTTKNQLAKAKGGFCFSLLWGAKNNTIMDNDGWSILFYYPVFPFSRLFHAHLFGVSHDAVDAGFLTCRKREDLVSTRHVNFCIPKGSGKHAGHNPEKPFRGAS